MKKEKRAIKKAVFLICVFAIASCKKSVEITELISDPDQPIVGDTVTHVALTNGKVEKIDYSWEITHLDGSKVMPLEVESNSMKWVPEKVGQYTIQANTSRGKKSDIATQTLIVTDGIGDFFQVAINGKWTGHVSTPWVDDYAVEMEFFSNGGYSGSCTDGTSVALYYGTDADSDLKTYTINLTPDGETTAAGDIVVYFDGGTTVNDEIKDLVISEDGETLMFNVWHNETFGPIEFDLSRD